MKPQNVQPPSSIPDESQCPKHTTKSFEEILEDLGCFGNYQKLVLFYYMFLEIGSAFIVFIPVFDTRVSNTTINCFTDTNGTLFQKTPPYPGGDLSDSNSIFWKNIGEAIGGKYLFFFESPADEWNLRCERIWIIDMASSSYMVGMIIGSVMWSQLADYYGRRPVYFSIVVNMFVGTALCALSPTVLVYAFARLIAGMSTGGFTNISYMAVMEFMTPKWRSYAISAGCLGEGIIILSVLGYFIRSWRCLYLATLVPYALILPLYFVLPETPRWLLKNGKKQELEQLLSVMAKFNGRPPVPPEVISNLFRQDDFVVGPNNVGSANKSKMSYRDFFRNTDLRRASLLLTVVWFTTNISYFGITYNIRNVPSSIYVSLGLVGVANGVGQKLTTPCSDRVGRRRAMLYGMIVGAFILVTFSVCFLAIKDIPTISISLGCMGGLLAVCMSRATLKILTSETFPTEVRAMGLGIPGVGAYLAGMISPQLAYIGGAWPSITYLIFAVASVIGPIMGFSLKETNAVPLPDEEQKPEK